MTWINLKTKRESMNPMAIWFIGVLLMIGALSAQAGCKEEIGRYSIVFNAIDRNRDGNLSEATEVYNDLKATYAATGYTKLGSIGTSNDYNNDGVFSSLDLSYLASFFNTFNKGVVGACKSSEVRGFAVMEALGVVDGKLKYAEELTMEYLVVALVARRTFLASLDQDGDEWASYADLFALNAIYTLYGTP